MVDRIPGPAPSGPHGTRAAIRRHERHGEKLCEPCRVERNRLAKMYYERRRRQRMSTTDWVDEERPECGCIVWHTCGRENRTETVLNGVTNEHD